MSTKIYTRYVNDPTTTEVELHVRSGQTVELIGKPFAPDQDEPDNIVQRVRFSDGYEADAFEDELSEES